MRNAFSLGFFVFFGLLAAFLTLVLGLGLGAAMLLL